MEFAIDVGGTKIAYAVVDKNRILASDRVETRQEPPEQQLREVGRRLRAMAKDQKASPKVVGLSLPGPIARDTLLQAPNLPKGWVGQRLQDYAAMLALDLPLFAQRDALMGGLGEYAAGAGRGLQSFFYITLGTGIGGGLILDGQPVLGADGAAGEVGHFQVEPRGPVCGCGRRGCVEAIAAGRAIEHAYETRTGQQLNGKEIADRARSGDAVALSVYRRAGRALGVACAVVAQVANPHAVIAGGSLSESLDLLQPSLLQSLRQRAWSANLPLPILPAQLGGPAPLIGAAYFARRGLENK
jgi:glucokinase